MKKYIVGFPEQILSILDRWSRTESKTYGRILKSAIAMYDYVQKNCSSGQKVVFEKENDTLMISLIEKSGLVKKVSSKKR